MKGSRFLGAGSALLVLIFTFLCLTVSALMSFSRAQMDMIISKEIEASVQAYYSADCRAVEAAATLRDAILSGEFPEKIDGISVAAEKNGVFSLSVPVGEGRVIIVSLSEDENGFKILSWRETPVKEWRPDDTLTVYTGEDAP